MNSVYEVAKKSFDNNYFVEALTDNESNKEQIKSFSGGPKGAGLEYNLKSNGWIEMEKGNSIYYLVKDRKTHEIASYFSIKCGLLYEPQHYEQLESEDKDFVDLLADAIERNDNKAITNYKASELYTIDKFEELYQDAIEKLRAKEDKRSSNSFNVQCTHSAIEVENLCRNHNYKSSKNSISPIGFQTFWLAVVPIIERVASLIGCRYAYLFAADCTKTLHLVEYYRDRFGFESMADLSISVIRPNYDEDCIEMFSSVKELITQQTFIWDQFADLYGLV